MTATCKCKNGHTWLTRVLADEPDTNVTVVEDDVCEECGSEDFEIIDVEYDSDL